MTLLAGLTACGGSRDSDAAAEAPETPSASATTASATPPPVGLRETCPEVERAISSIDPVLSEPSEIDGALADVETLYDAGDTETQNALDGLIESLEISRDATQGQSSLDAMGAFLDALNNLADRCKAVGSSALQ